MRYPFLTILSPVDFDENSFAALDAARDIAASHGSTIHVLHVVPSVLSPKDASAAYGAQEEVVRAKLRELAAQRLAGVRHVVHSRAGDTDESICNLADEIGADLIVIATHGRTGFPHFLLGSVAEKVVRGARCPVLSLRPPSSERQ